jgi:DNA polymerase delta subunit 1
VVDVVAGVRVVVEAPTGDDVAELALASEMATKWAVVKDDVSPQELFRLHVGSPDDRAKIASYCIQDCILVRDLYKKLDVFNNAMAMANACSVPIPYIFTRGQGVKIESLIFKECYQRGQCVKVLPTTAFGSAAATNEDSYEGAIVLEPKPGIYYESPIGVADFASLYPSTIISENISFDTLLWVKDFDLAGNFKGFVLGAEMAADATAPDVQWTDISFDVWGSDPTDKRKHPAKVKQGMRVCRYAQYDSGVKGTLPQIVQKLLATRKEKRKEAAKESDPFKKALLDAEQLAYKLTANSLYGQLGSATFKIRLQHLAASVTAYGRKQIMFAKAAIERFYGPGSNDPRCSAEIVYGDTDSLFVNFNPVGPDGKRLEGKAAIEATMHLTEEAGKFVTRVLKAPHDFEYDKVFYPFIIFSKKRYVGNKYEESADSYYQNSMGIATKRRDYAPIVKVIYGGAIRILLTERSVKAAYEFVQEKLLELVEGKISMNLLTMSKSLRAEYKTPSPPAHKVLADRMRLRDEGTAPASGERVPFIYILPPTGQVASKLQGDRVEHPTYIREKGLKPDYKFYIQHQLMNPLVQLFALVVEQIPGVTVPNDGWEEGDREITTTQVMFEKILAMCDKAAVRRFGSEIFGVAKPVSTAPPKRTSERIASAAAAAANKKTKQQSSISTYFADKMLVKKLESAKKAP